MTCKPEQINETILAISFSRFKREKHKKSPDKPFSRLLTDHCVKMSSETKINCIITGAGGFVGQALASALLEDPLLSKLTLTDMFDPSPPKSKRESKVEVRCLKADLTSLETCQSLFTSDLNLVYILHGIMSGAAEANFELGLKVNLDSTRQILDILRQTNPGVKVIYPSSLAVYGPPATPTTKVTELNTPVPGSSYGAQKHICETLLDDYSRRGYLDGRTCRLPTVSCEVPHLQFRSQVH